MSAKGGLLPDSYPATNLQKRTFIRSPSARARRVLRDLWQWIPSRGSRGEEASRRPIRSNIASPRPSRTARRQVRLSVILLDGLACSCDAAWRTVVKIGPPPTAFHVAVASGRRRRSRAALERGCGVDAVAARDDGTWWRPLRSARPCCGDQAEPSGADRAKLFSFHQDPFQLRPAIRRATSGPNMFRPRMKAPKPSIERWAKVSSTPSEPPPLPNMALRRRSRVRKNAVVELRPARFPEDPGRRRLFRARAEPVQGHRKRRDSNTSHPSLLYCLHHAVVLN